MKIRFKPLYRVILICISIGVPLSFLLIDGPYLFSQGFSMLRLRSGMKNISDLLQREELDAETRDFFLLSQDIRRFAIEELGLQDTPNYTSYVATDKNYLVDVVSAVRSDSLERFERSYPLVGKVFYRGFFKKRQAERFALRLEKKGYDVITRRVSAYSSLGMLTDPLYSYMTHYDTYRLAELIIHEQVHSTLWIPGYNEFNEEIATFIGREGALEYVRRRYGSDAPLIPEIQKERKDYISLLNFFLDLYGQLETRYAELPEKTDRLAVKSEILEGSRRRFSSSYEEMFLTERYSYLKEMEWNHALIDLYAQYGRDLSSFYRLFEYLGGCLTDTTKLLLTTFKDVQSSPHQALYQLHEGFEISLQNLN
ncbi:MAG: aminopeptidase [Spirochaetaceae bacterium]